VVDWAIWGQHYIGSRTNTFWCKIIPVRERWKVRGAAAAFMMSIGTWRRIYYYLCRMAVRLFWDGENSDKDAAI